jgi:hypothetical protein
MPTTNNYTYHIEIEFNGQSVKHTCKSVHQCVDWINKLYGVDVATIAIINNLIYGKVKKGTLNNLQIIRIDDSDNTHSVVSNIGVSPPAKQRGEYHLECEFKGIKHEKTFTNMIDISNYLNSLFGTKLVSATMVSEKVRNIHRDNVLKDVIITKK